MVENTIKLLICDDDEFDAETAKNIIKNTMKELHINSDIEYCASASEIEELLIHQKNHTDILVLDIDMPHESGMELASKIRQNNINVIIIFLSNHDEYVFKSIEYQPFRYIRKSRINAEMPLAVAAALKLIEMQVDNQVILDTESGGCRIMMSEIIYFESYKRKIMVHLSNGTRIQANANISDLLDSLKCSKFVMIHRSCVVNADYIRTIRNDVIILSNNEQLIISRRKTREVKQQILELWGETL